MREGKIEGRLEGELDGKLKILFELVNDNLLSIENAASRAGLTEDTFREKMKNLNKQK